tara:strand:- start:179 stop:382 length:204 start_codon:yes stop_codon:yes gene_type:complete
MTEYKVSVHYNEGTVLTIEADSPEQAEEKAQGILEEHAEAYYPKEYAPDPVHREYMVVDVLGGSHVT